MRQAHIGTSFSAGRRVLCTLAVSTLLTFPVAAFAQDWPTKPIRVVVAASAGGPADILGRLLAEQLGKGLGQPVLIENKPGAASMIGTEMVAKAARDGYTFLLTNDGPLTINPSLYPRLSYDPQKDLLPVARIATLPLVLVAHPSIPAKSTKELVALAKAQPGKLNYGAGGNTTRLAAEVLRGMTDIDVVHVPYKGSGPMVNALLANEVQFAFDGVASSVAQIKSGRLVALGVTGKHRLPTLPGVPTIAESGLPSYEGGTWIGLLAPAGVPKEVATRMHAELASVMANPEIQERLNALGMVPDLSSGEEFRTQIKSDTTRWADVIKRAGITADN
jgi:tripartite-type tricarboxylate transporter receptor subunit TctC